VASQVSLESHVSPDTNMTGPGCLTATDPEPCLLVIFGASGDLCARKLLPALARLDQVGRLPRPFAVVGAARTDMADEAFREKTRLAVAQAHGQDSPELEAFPALTHYHRLDYDNPDDYRSLAERLTRLENTLGLPGNRLFYLATPPELYPVVAARLGQAGLACCADNAAPWTRIVVEKPFGRDLPSARRLDATLHAHFTEDAIFRIDHYLAKETIQNILSLRFANAVFEPVWNRNYVEYVSIIAAESLGVEHRAGYYDQAGVLRDMFQNHMMQLLALAAMEPPSIFQAERVQDEKVKVYRSLRPFDVEKGFDGLVLGQYAEGVSQAGIRLPGYRQEPGVRPASATPTFAMLRAHVDNWRWQGVPFYLASGKALASKLTRIVVQFKEVPHSIFRGVLGEHVTANRLVLETYPGERIDMHFQVKPGGPRFCLDTARMSFDFRQGYQGPPLDSYEKVLIDCMLGDHMLFWRQDAVELCWGFLTPILAMCEACGDLESRLVPYPAGGWGPAEAGMVHLNFLRDTQTGRPE